MRALPRFAILLALSASVEADVDIPAGEQIPDGHVVVAASMGRYTIRLPRDEEVVGRDTPIPFGYVAVEWIDEWPLGPGPALRIRRPRDREWVLPGTPIPEGYVAVELRGRDKRARVLIRPPMPNDIVPVGSILPGRFAAVEHIAFHPPLAGPANRIREVRQSADVLAGTPIPKGFVIVKHEPGFKKGFVRICRPAPEEVVCSDSPIPPNYVVTELTGPGHYGIRIPGPREEVLAGSPIPPDYVVVGSAPQDRPGRVIIRRAGGMEPIEPGAPIPEGYVVTLRPGKGRASNYVARKPTERLWIIEESPVPKGWVVVARRTEGKQGLKQIREPDRAMLVAFDSPIPDGYEAFRYYAKHPDVAGPALSIRRVGRSR